MRSLPPERKLEPGSALAVIPARAGSTRLKNKNIYLLGGKPLIRWMTEAVIDSKCFDEVLISTDSDEIFNVVSDLPVSRHERPPEYATTESTVLDSMVNLIETHHKEYSFFSYFLPTCPFISYDDIKDGFSLLKNDSSINSVVSMTKYGEPIQLACVMNEGRDVVPIFDNLTSGLTNSKFIKEYYRPSGAFYMSSWSGILKYKNFFKGHTRGIAIPRERSIDINTLSDIELAEFMLKKN